MSQALQAAFHGLGLQLPVVGQQHPAAEQEEGGEIWCLCPCIMMFIYLHTTVCALQYIYCSMYTVEHVHYLHTTVYLQYVYSMCNSTYTADCCSHLLHCTASLMLS